MTPIESIKSAVRNYANFNGRANRPEFWWFYLFVFIVVIVTIWIPVVGIIIALALLLPSLSVTARRLHDMGQSGWWQLLYLVPFGGIAVLVMCAQPGTNGPNMYGPISQSQSSGGYGYTGIPYTPPVQNRPTPPPQPAGVKRYCTQCGAEIQEAQGVRFCTVCGASV